MSDEPEKPGFKLSIEGFDPLGLKSAGEIAKESVQFGIDGAKAFLKLTCKPLLEELGLLMKDKVTNWRLNNIISMLEKAQGKLNYDPEKEKLVIEPRLAYQIVEHASIVSNDTLQDMWAGLFAASCQHYEEDENILFIDFLKRLTSSQVKMINYLCEQSFKGVDFLRWDEHAQTGLISPGSVEISFDQMLSVMETTSRLKAETEFSALESMGLVIRSQPNMSIYVELKSGSFLGPRPSLLALRLFVKGQGSSKSPFEYFLPQLADHYYELLKDFVSVSKENVLDYIRETSVFGIQFDKDLNFTATTLRLNNPEWLTLPLEEINKRISAFIIAKRIRAIDKTNLMSGNLEGYTFSYKTGLVKIED